MNIVDPMIVRIAAAMVAIALFMLLRRVGIEPLGSPRRADVVAAGISATFFVTFVACALAWQPTTQVAPPDRVAPFFEVSGFCRIARPAVHDAGIGVIEFERSGGVGVRDDEHIAWAKRFVIAGWAADRRGAAPAVAVCPEVDGKISTTAIALYGVWRVDLSTKLRSSGFAIAFLEGRLPHGKHRIAAVVLSRDGSWQRIGSAVTLTIT